MNRVDGEVIPEGGKQVPGVHGQLVLFPGQGLVQEKSFFIVFVLFSSREWEFLLIPAAATGPDVAWFPD